MRYLNTIHIRMNKKPQFFRWPEILPVLERNCTLSLWANAKRIINTDWMDTVIYYKHKLKYLCL